MNQLVPGHDRGLGPELRATQEDRHVETERSSGAIISIRNLRKTFKRRAGGGDVKAVDDISLDVHLHELVVLLGPSGCGKTTLLRCVAGLDRPDAGEISIDGDVVFSSAERIFVPPNRRRLSMIFQSYALWPHMSVFENVAYPLRSQRKKLRRTALHDKVERVLEVAELAGLGEQYPGQLSGGQQQRVALARALVADPKVILFDEPLSNVDALVREQLRVEVLAMQRRLGFAALYVTHDQTEAMELAHYIAVMREGKFAQVDTARAIYHAPRSLYVANFVGTSNTLEAELRSLDDGVGEVVTSVGTVTITAAGVAADVRQRFHAEGAADCVLVFRPEALELRSTVQKEDSRGRWHGQIVAVMFSGPHVEYILKVGGHQMRALSRGDQEFDEGSVVEFELKPDSLLALPPSTG